ncbi:MAG: transcription elongation factor GreA [Candidatus Uhrbacteria bacterium]|nr:transcription elongation factor GreA [Patescibacteria group bacterium]MBU1906710.1 transcription elongation factor GreA [Patescibacteria group bacterium]
MDSTYLSAEKFEELKAELEQRQREERRLIAARIEQAKELGDLSENFEYHEAKEQQAQNEGRIGELQDMVRNAVIVEEKTGGSTIHIGTKFSAEINGEEKEFELVGSTEADPLAGKISNETPVGMAFLGKAVGEDIEVDLPRGKVTYKVTKIL